MAFSNEAVEGLSSEINVTPLIDVLLVLLIIFMVIVPLMPRGLDSSLPQGKGDAATIRPTLVEVNAGTKPGEVMYRVNQREVAQEALGPVLRRILVSQPEHTVDVKADRELTYEPVANVVAEAHQAGASQVELSTQR